MSGLPKALAARRDEAGHTGVLFNPARQASDKSKRERPQLNTAHSLSSAVWVGGESFDPSTSPWPQRVSRRRKEGGKEGRKKLAVLLRGFESSCVSARSSLGLAPE